MLNYYKKSPKAGSRFAVFPIKGKLLCKMSNKYITIENLEAYSLARKLSRKGWAIYKSLSYRDIKIMGDQFIRSIDSIGANIIEGYGRYQYLDKIRFYYIARASLQESCVHWLELLFERVLITEETLHEIKEIFQLLQIKLNNFITATRKVKDNK